jgi:hypothetical protein
MYLDKNSGKKWLIKSENRIMGPFGFDEVLDLLRKRQISIIDEVRDPETRWLYVRENPEFKNVVEEIRQEIDAKQESTKTLQNTSITGTYTSSNTMSSIQNNSPNSTGNTALDDILQKTKTDLPANFDESMPSPRDIEVVNETVFARVERPTPRFSEKAKLYGVQSDVAVQKKMNNFSSQLKWALSALVIFVCGGYGGYTYYQQKHEVRKEEDLVIQVTRLKQAGLYEKSAEKFYNLPETTRNEILPKILDIFPVLQRAGNLSFDQIKSLKGFASFSTDQRVQVLLIQFWLAQKDQNYGVAQEFIIKALGISPSDPLSKENDAWLALKRAKASDAYAEFSDLYKKSKDESKTEGRYLYGRIASYAALSEAEKAPLSRDLLNDLDRYTTTYFNLRKELLLAQIYLAMQLNDVETYKFSIEKFFNTPPQLSQFFLKPALLMSNAYRWEEFASFKSAISSRLTGDEQILFEFHNHLELGHLAEATQFLSVNQSKVLNPQVKEQMQLLLLNEQGNARDAVALVKAKGLDMSSVLNNFLGGMNLVKNDPSQNPITFTQALNNQKADFYSAWINLDQLKGKKASDAEIQTFIKNNFYTLDNFIPVIETRMNNL